MIWLIDYTHYKKQIDPRLEACKRDYFRIKQYKRFFSIGPSAPVQSRVYSLGLLRIATILHRNHVPVKYLHYYMLEQILEQGTDEWPEIIAFSCVCPTVPLCAELASKVKKASPQTEVILGGVHVNLNPRETAIRFPVFDKLSIGYELEAASHLAGKDLQDVVNTYADFSLLPFPLKEYAINTFTAAGCRFKCSYCVDGRSPHFEAMRDGQIREMKQLLPERNLIHFFDSVLGYSQRGLHEVCTAIKKTEHNFLLSCDMRADILTKELVKEMEEAGFVELRMGIESADQEILKKNGRTLQTDVLYDTLQLIREHSGMYITLYSITGLPGTTKEAQESSLQYFDMLFKRQLVDEIKNTLYVPYPVEGVDYSETGVRILTEDWSKYDRQSYPVFETEWLGADELWDLYIETAGRINQSWLESIGFDHYSTIPLVDPHYTEYIIENYKIEQGESHA